MKHIAIVWDFDLTLTPKDSTTATVEILDSTLTGDEFWKYIKSLRGDSKKSDWEHILASDAPIWMYSLSRLAAKKKVPLNKEFFKKFVAPYIELFPNVIEFLKATKAISKNKKFRDQNIEIHHFIVSAGLKDLIEEVFPTGLITWVFGCRYEVVVDKEHKDEPESVPVFCMDETMKTRSLFEISKGTFSDSSKEVNNKVAESDLWTPFNNIIYIGDGPTDIPALALTRSRGGVGIAVYNEKSDEQSVNKRLRKLRLDKRADLITAANFSLEGELFQYIENRCLQICQRYEAESQK